MTAKPRIDAGRKAAARLTLTGRVQGIGMRPALARFAQQLSLSGYVLNTCSGVEVHVEGASRDVVQFEQQWRAHLPSEADISSLKLVSVQPQGLTTFCLDPGTRGRNDVSNPDAASTGDLLTARVPPDVVVCDDCCREVQDAGDRRHGYAFTSCTTCGPRYSIVTRMPYEREQTSMSSFPLCARCRVEYQAPADRRFHAQTNACPDCGPQVWLRDAENRTVARDETTWCAAAAALRAGRIVALRGLGGYQLLVDASSPEAVERLRLRKRRRGKPLAVMVASLADATQLARIDEGERRWLSSSAGPIVVVELRDDASLASAVTAGLNTVGLMLPTTPLHWLLINATGRPLVCTSANMDGEPLVYESTAALQTLRDVADLWIEHDRPIQRPVDDSVIRVIDGQPCSIRLARGLAPHALDMQCAGPLLAVGGHQKTSLALGNGAQSILGPHVGDLDTVATRRRFLAQAEGLSDLYGLEGPQLVCDLHPGYFTSSWADDQPAEVVRVQHHHAHIAAGMLEHGWHDRQVLGVSFDGTGYGTDGTIWGGEFLLATLTDFERVGHLRPFRLPGGERAVRQPWRVATSLVYEAAGEQKAAELAFSGGDASALLPVLRRERLSPVTTSAGRLFDGIAALILNVEQCAFEGQAAMLLESVCDHALKSRLGVAENGQYELPIREGQPKQLDWRPLVRSVLRERALGVDPGEMALRFHRGLASAIVRFCRSYSSLPVVLGGGVFQNRVLLQSLAARFANINQPLGQPRLIPPNDGGLAAGQLAVASARQRRTASCA